MTWVERMLEERLAAAARAGELDGGPLAGRPLPDLDRPRRPGWWAERFVERERSHDRRIAAEADMRRARIGFWSATSLEEVERRVAAANRDVVSANLGLVDDDRLEPFDVGDVLLRWGALRAGSRGHADPGEV